MALKKPRKVNPDIELIKGLIDSGELRITKDQKPALQTYLKAHFGRRANRIKRGTLSSAAARKGLPDIFIDGKQVDITGVTQYALGKKDKLGFTGAKLSAEANKKRESTLRLMTDQTGAATKSSYGRKARGLPKNQEDHHILFRTLFEPFYEGLDEDDAKWMTNYLVEKGTPLGNVLENLQGIDKDLHKELHTWAKQVGIEVKAGPPGHTNFQRDSEGNIRRVLGPSDLDPEGKQLTGSKMLNFEGVPLDDRLNHLDEYVELVVPALREKTAEIVHLEELINEQQGGPKARTKEAILQEFQNQSENVKSRSTLIKKGVNPADLDVKPKNILQKVGSAVNKVPRPLRKIARAAIPVATPFLSLPARAEAKEEYEQNPSLLNWAQLQGENIALGGSTLSAAGLPLLTNPVTAVPGAAMIAAGETVDAVGTGISLGTDVVKGAMNPAKISTKNRKLFRHGGNKEEKAEVRKQRELMLEMLQQQRKNQEFETGGR